MEARSQRGEQAADADAPVALLLPDWTCAPSVRAGFSLRSGGVSTGRYAALNLGAHVGDEPIAVAENRRRLRGALGLAREPLWLAQQHGIAVVDADRLEPSVEADVPPQADAAVTRSSGRALVVLVADCLPVLLARADGAAVAVAHAGWRGLAAGVLEAALSALDTDPANVQVWIGPAISQAHFEVGSEVRDAFCGPRPEAAAAFERNARGRWQCDLHALARQRLATAGVTRVWCARRCTFAEPAALYSFRRDGATGRMAAVIWLES